MEFNITHLDKVLLLQTLYVHADPKGYGEKQYRDLLKQGKIVEGLPEEECRKILSQKYPASGYLVDYHNGKPLKLDWRWKEGGQVFANSIAYDVAHGRFRFFEALLNVFDPEEILITKREYDLALEKLHFKNEDTRIVEYELAQILAYAIPIHGTDPHWRIDPNNNGYKSSFLNGLEI